jgi:hypothetical protein
MKIENFVAGIVTITQIRPVRIDELQLGRKLQKINGWGLIFLFLSAKFFVSDVGDST